MKKYFLIFISILLFVGCSTKKDMEKEFNNFVDKAENNGYVMKIENDESTTIITVEEEKYFVVQELDDVSFSYYCGYETYDVGEAIDLTSDKICEDDLYGNSLKKVEESINDTVFLNEDNKVEYKKNDLYVATGSYSSGNVFSLKLSNELIFDDGKNVVTIQIK